MPSPATRGSLAAYYPKARGAAARVRRSHVEASIRDSLILRWVDATILDLGRQMRWSYLPPLMVYLAYGVSGLTAIVGMFFVKDYLGLSASFQQVF